MVMEIRELFRMSFPAHRLMPSKIVFNLQSPTAILFLLCRLEPNALPGMRMTVYTSGMDSVMLVLHLVMMGPVEFAVENGQTAFIEWNL
jgi:hypothetical protein